MFAEMPPFDHRLTPARPDLAALSLKGQVEAARFVAPVPMQVGLAVVPLRKAPDVALGYETELLPGEAVDVYETHDGWAWLQAKRDGYVGYAPEAALVRDPTGPTHRVSALRTFLYPEPSIKLPPLGLLPYGAELAVTGEEGKFARIAGGYLFAAHLAPLDARAADPVAEAERFLGTPYLWGGKSSLGLDCSALAQTAFRAAGIAIPRDSDMQEKSFGTKIAIPNDPAHFRRGDLLFWKGHVAIAQGDGQMIHATAYSMSVISERIGPALERIAAGGDTLRTVRRHG